MILRGLDEMYRSMMCRSRSVSRGAKLPRYERMSADLSSGTMTRAVDHMHASRGLVLLVDAVADKDIRAHEVLRLTSYTIGLDHNHYYYYYYSF